METKLELKDRQSLYKLTIPLEVENKIRLLLSRIYNIEWSGVLFYDIVEDEDKLEVICKDILPLNIGDSTYTSFDNDSRIVGYALEKDLLDYKQGLVHSHHSMKTFFSGTDLHTLEVEGTDSNNFVSLIVNNEGTYNAAITWKQKSEVTSSETFFGKLRFKNKPELVESICYSFMTVNRETTTYTNEDLEKTIDELKEAKKKEVVTIKLKQQFPRQGNLFEDMDSPWGSTKTIYPRSWQEAIKQEIEDNKDSIETIDAKDWQKSASPIEIDNKLQSVIDDGVARLVLLSFIAKKLSEKDLAKTISLVNKRTQCYIDDNQEELLQYSLEAFIDLVLDDLVTFNIETIQNSQKEDFVDEDGCKCILAGLIWDELQAKKFAELNHLEIITTCLFNLSQY